MIREAQSALASIKDSAPVSASTSESLEQFLGKLPDSVETGRRSCDTRGRRAKGEEASHLEDAS